MDFPIAYPFDRTPLFISNAEIEYSAMDTVRTLVGPGVTSNTWPTAFTILYYPFAIPFAYPVRRVFWMNGSTITANVAMGIMSGDGGARIYATASTAQSGASLPQYVTPSPDFILPPGDYYWALQVSAATASIIRGYNSMTTVLNRQGGALQEAAASMGIPAVMTPAQFSGGAVWPFMGITRTASGY
jgi:hypothetical protein